MYAQEFIYTPLTPEAAAASLGVSYETFCRKMRDKLSIGVKDLIDGVLNLDQYVVMVFHFAANNPKAAEMAYRMDRTPKRTDETDDAPNGRTDDKTDDETDAHKTDDIKTDDAQNGRYIKRTDDKTDDIKTDDAQNGRYIKRTNGQKNGRIHHNTNHLSELYSQIESLQLELKNKEIDTQKALLSQKDSIQRDLSKQFAEKLASEKTDAQSDAQSQTDALRSEMVRLKQEITENRTQHRILLEQQASDFKKNNQSNLDVLSENVRLKVTDETRKTVTSTIRKEVQNEYSTRFEKLQNEHYATIQQLQKELQEGRLLVNQLSADVQLFNKKWEFKIKKIWDSELSVINVLSNVLAFVGLTLVFSFIGALAAILMIFFFKNVMKNVKIAKREEAAKFGMFIAFGIEGVYGFFHYTTFYNLLIHKEASLLIPDANIVALCMTIIISGLSISALVQSRKQAKDDIS